MNTKKIYEDVTKKIIGLIENHQLKYDKSWISLGNDGKPSHNADSQRVYSGINQFLLSLISMDREYVSNGWLTFKQCKELGGSIEKGSKSVPIYFYKTLFIDDVKKKYSQEEYSNFSSDRQAKIKKIPVLKQYNVFNLSQTKDLPESFYTIEDKPQLNEFERDEKAEELIFSTDAKIEIKESNRAFYHSGTDSITLPLREQFKSTQPFYGTALHELGHWTGHENRLDRKLANPFGSKEYAKEELIAELCSAYLCASLGFSKTISNNAAYLQSWLSCLKQDAKFIFTASAKAQKAADYILNFNQSDAI